jgi:glucan phosphoethanolaminetransferase (alkaline phosphatase superfamily)
LLVFFFFFFFFPFVFVWNKKIRERKIRLKKVVADINNVRILYGYVFLFYSYFFYIHQTSTFLLHSHIQLLEWGLRKSYGKEGVPVFFFPFKEFVFG